MSSVHLNNTPERIDKQLFLMSRLRSLKGNNIEFVRKTFQGSVTCSFCEL